MASQKPFVLYSAVTLVFGVLNAATGPVLPDLEGQAGTDSAGMGAVFACRGAGSMLGGIVAGLALDSVRDPHRLLVVLLACKLSVELTIPFGSSPAVLGCQFCVMAASANAISTVATTAVAWTYGKLMGPQMNVMNAFFGVGAALAQIVAEASYRFVGRAVFAYWAIAAMDMLLIVAAMIVPATPNPRLSAASGKGDPQKAGNDYVALDEPIRTVDWWVVSLSGASVLLAGVCESAISFWLFHYLTNHLQLSRAVGAAVNTAFHVAFTATRFVCAWLAAYLSAAEILTCSLAFAFLSFLAILLPSWAAWLACAGIIGVGIGVAPFAANIITVLGQKSFVSGTALGTTRIMAACGAMIGSSGTGFLQKAPFISYEALPLVVCSGLLLEAVVTLQLLRR